MSDNLPVTTLAEALPYLRRPFDSAAMRFKVQAQWPKSNPSSGLIVSYIDARLVIERLNLVVPDWSDDYAFYGDRVDSGLIVCHLTVAGTTRSDVGEGKGKAGWSDAFKRAGVKFGIGAVCYALARVTLDTAGKGKPALIVQGSGAKKSLRIGDDAEAWLRANYSRWLGSKRNTFGPALSHGDVENSVGAALEEAPEAEGPDVPTLELAARREEVEALYTRLIVEGEGKKAKLPKGRFNAQFRAAETLEALDELADRIREAAA